MSKPINTGEGKKKKKRGSKAPTDKDIGDDDFIPVSSKKPKIFIGEVGWDNLEVETIQQIENYDQPSNGDSEDDMNPSEVGTEPDGTADHLPPDSPHIDVIDTLPMVNTTNLESSSSRDTNTDSSAIGTRLFKDNTNPNKSDEGFRKPTTPLRLKGNKSTKDNTNPPTPTPVIDNTDTEVDKLRAELALKKVVLEKYEHQINLYRHLINDPDAKEQLSQARKANVTDTEGSTYGTPWSIHDFSKSKGLHRPSSTETTSTQSTQTIPSINNSNVNLTDIPLADREQFLLNRIAAGDVANKFLYDQIKATEDKVLPFTPISNEPGTATRWTPSGSLSTTAGIPTINQTPYQYSTIVTKPLATETPIIKSWSHSEVLLFETWCNRHNVKQMTTQNAWDIISSTFNDDILETLNQLVAIQP
jgi:hypothetical protein